MHYTGSQAVFSSVQSSHFHRQKSLLHTLDLFALLAAVGVSSVEISACRCSITLRLWPRLQLQTSLLQCVQLQSPSVLRESTAAPVGGEKYNLSSNMISTWRPSCPSLLLANTEVYCHSIHHQSGAPSLVNYPGESPHHSHRQPLTLQLFFCSRLYINDHCVCKSSLYIYQLESGQSMNIL